MMKPIRADLHIHSVLSPCGDLEMSPLNIVNKACEKGIGIIGLTDHNTTRHVKLMDKLAAEKDLFLLKGAEVTTREEVHCLVFFEKIETLNQFQEYLDMNLPDIKNTPKFFGEQLQVDENEVIIYEEERLLAGALNKSISELEKYVHSLDGIFIPAHIDRMKNSIYSQLGFLPENLEADALEISWASSPEEFILTHKEVERFCTTRSSDAHFIDAIGRATTLFLIKEPSFIEIKMALKGENGRRVIR